MQRASRSEDLDLRLEGETALILKDKMVPDGFRKKIKGGAVGEIDIETDEFIIDVTNGKSSKEATTFSKYFDAEKGADLINTEGKRVILYAPNIKPSKIKPLEDAGVIVITDIETLKKRIGVN